MLLPCSCCQKCCVGRGGQAVAAALIFAQAYDTNSLLPLTICPALLSPSTFEAPQNWLYDGSGRACAFPSAR